MSWRDLIIANLPPPPPEGEPVQLRNDILDEIADHLECATRRELRQIDDPEQARKNAIERFGDPRAIARQLWLDAMKEQLMNQRIMIGTQLLSVLAIVALCIVVVMALRQNQRVNEALLAKLGSVSSAPSNDAAFHWPTFKIRVRPASADKGIPDLRVTLNGEPYRDGEKATLSATTNADGDAAFGPIRPGSYSLRVLRGPNMNGHYQQNVTVPPGEQPPLVIQWPEPQMQMVSVPVKSSVPPALAELTQILIVPLTQYLNGVGGQGHWSGTGEHIAINSNGQVAKVPTDHSLRMLMNADGVFLDSDVVSTLEWDDAIELDSSWNYAIGHSKFCVGKFDPESKTWRWDAIGVWQQNFTHPWAKLEVTEKSPIDITLKPEEIEQLAQFAQRIHSPQPPRVPRTRPTTRPQESTPGQ